MEQLEKQDKTVRKLKKQLKVFAKKIGELEGILNTSLRACFPDPQTDLMVPTLCMVELTFMVFTVSFLAIFLFELLAFSVAYEHLSKGPPLPLLFTIPCIIFGPS